MNFPVRALAGFNLPGVPKIIQIKDINLVARHLQAYLKPQPHYDRFEIEKVMMSHELVTKCMVDRKDNLVQIVVDVTNGNSYRMTVRWSDPIS